MGTAEARCLVAGSDLFFLGNSVVRRQMYTLLDLLAANRAHRQLPDLTSIELGPKTDSRLINSSWVWDMDGHHNGCDPRALELIAPIIFESTRLERYYKLAASLFLRFPPSVPCILS